MRGIGETALPDEVRHRYERESDDLPERMPKLEVRDTEMNGPFGLANIVFAFTLYVAAEVLGWPSANDVNVAL